jgi:hypothetical protein
MNTQFASTHKYAKFGRGSTYLESRLGQPIEMGAIAQYCPSVLAEDKHSSRSERYTYVSTMDVIEALGGEGFRPFSIMQGGSKDEEKRGFTKHLIRFRHAAQPVVKGDSQYEVVMLGSHDGTTSTQLFGGFFRALCKNGTLWFNGEATKIKVPHIGNIIPQVIEGAYTVVKQAPLALEQLDTFRAIQLSSDEQRAFADAASVLRFDEESPIDSGQLLVARRDADSASDLHTVFNVVQENVIRGGLGYSRREERKDGTSRIVHRETRPVRSVDGDVRLNRALWTLAEEMAKIKQAA